MKDEIGGGVAVSLKIADMKIYFFVNAYSNKFRKTFKIKMFINFMQIKALNFGFKLDVSEFLGGVRCD